VSDFVRNLVRRSAGLPVAAASLVPPPDLLGRLDTARVQAATPKPLASAPDHIVAAAKAVATTLAVAPRPAPAALSSPPPAVPAPPPGSAPERARARPPVPFPAPWSTTQPPLTPRAREAADYTRDARQAPAVSPLVVPSSMTRPLPQPRTELSRPRDGGAPVAVPASMTLPGLRGLNIPGTSRPAASRAPLPAPPLVTPLAERPAPITPAWQTSSKTAFASDQGAQPVTPQPREARPVRLPQLRPVQAPGEPAQPATAVLVRIGRIEVRAAQSPARTPPPPVPRGRGFAEHILARRYLDRAWR